MNDAPVDRARAHRAHRLAEIGRSWGLVSVSPASVPSWVPAAGDLGESILVPGFVAGPSAATVELVCRELRALGCDRESALFWLAAPNASPSRRVPIDLVELGHARAVLTAARLRFDQHPPHWLTPAAVARRLGISKAAALALIENRRLSARQTGSGWRVDYDDYLRFHGGLVASIEDPGTGDLRRLDLEDRRLIDELDFAQEARAEGRPYVEADEAGMTWLVTADGTRHPLISNTSIDDVMEMLESVVDRTEDAEQSLSKPVQAPSDLQGAEDDPSASELEVRGSCAGDGKPGDSE